MFGGVGKSAGWATILGTVGFVLSGSVSAKAADLGGNCCADLEERVAELEATTARKGNRKVSLTVSGWVNEAVFGWDDGTEQNVYVGTNALEQSRFRFTGSAKIDKDWSAGYVLEIGLQGQPSSQWNQIQDGSTNLLAINQNNGLIVRKSNWFIKSNRLGPNRRWPQRHRDVPPARRCRFSQHAQLCRRRGTCGGHGRICSEAQWSLYWRL